MKIEVNLCGIFSDIVKNTNVILDNVQNTDDILSHFNRNYNEFSKYKTIRIINKKIINRNEMLHEGDSITIMPLYIGG